MLMSAPPSGKSEEHSEEETSHERGRSTSSLRSTASDEGQSASPEQADCVLPPINRLFSDERSSRMLPSLAFILGSETPVSSPAVSSLTHEVKEMELDSAAGSPRPESQRSTSSSASVLGRRFASPAARSDSDMDDRTVREDSSDDEDKSPLPHKKTRISPPDESSDIVARRLQTIKMLAILSNHVYRMSLSNSSVQPEAPKQESVKMVDAV